MLDHWETSKHRSRSSGLHRVPAPLVQWRGEKVIKCKSNTFNLADIIDCIPTNTCFTSRATVAGNGRQYSGHPVFIRSLKPQSFTIAKGCLLSAIQQTISILVRMYHSFLISSKLNNIPCLCVCVLMMRIGGLFLTDVLKSLGNTSVSLQP